MAAGRLPVTNCFARRGPSASTRATEPSSPPATHTAPSPTASAVGSWPTPTDHETRLLLGSIRASVPSCRLATHTAPSPYASALGPLPTGIGRTLRLRGSMRVTVPDSSLATHSAPPPATIAEGFAPTGIVTFTRPLARSRPRMRPSTPDATHTTPSANASERGTLPIGHRLATLLAPGSTCASSREPLSATHSDPPP